MRVPPRGWHVLSPSIASLTLLLASPPTAAYLLPSSHASVVVSTRVAVAAAFSARPRQPPVVHLGRRSLDQSKSRRGMGGGRRRLSTTSHASSPSPSSSPSIDEKEGGRGAALTNEEISRYSRHLVLGSVGMSGQCALKNSCVLVIGAGGLGSPCLLYLAAAGVGHIGIVDADVVDESNLQRQVIHGTSTIGMSKCESARRRILDINPHVRVRVYEEEFTSVTASRILGDGFSVDMPTWNVVVDGSDNFPTKYLINDACDMHGLPWVYSAVLAFEGQVSTFNYMNVGPNYRDLLPTPPPPGDVPSCAEGGVLGVLPGTMGCIQATEAIKIILGMDGRGLLSGRCLTFDALTMKFGEVGITRSPDRRRATELIDYQGFCAGPSTATPPKRAISAKEDSATGGGRTMDEAPTDDGSGGGGDDDYIPIGPIDCLEKLTGGWSPWVLDVRLKAENDIVSLPFTDIVVPYREVGREHIPKDGEILIYCKGGVRGKKACNRLIGLGVDPRRLYNLEGGILRWQKEVDPQMPRY
jgi:molybdopterin/thiamine biosynthesis adenylyltransferase/rhodanese-related sulfurtransferase